MIPIRLGGSLNTSTFNWNWFKKKSEKCSLCIYQDFYIIIALDPI